MCFYRLIFTADQDISPLDVAREMDYGAIFQLIKVCGGVSGEEASFDPTSGHIDLASAQIGGQVRSSMIYKLLDDEMTRIQALWASNEWFAAASNLLKSGRGTFSPLTVRTPTHNLSILCSKRNYGKFRAEKHRTEISSERLFLSPFTKENRGEISSCA